MLLDYTRVDFFFVPLRHAKCTVMPGSFFLIGGERLQGYYIIRFNTPQEAAFYCCWP